MKVEAVDAYDNATALSSSAATVLTVSAGGLGLYGDMGCTTLKTSFSIPSRATSTTLYFKAGSPGVYPLTVSAPGVTAASQDEQVTAAP